MLYNIVSLDFVFLDRVFQTISSFRANLILLASFLCRESRSSSLPISLSAHQHEVSSFKTHTLFLPAFPLKIVILRSLVSRLFATWRFACYVRICQQPASVYPDEEITHHPKVICALRSVFTPTAVILTSFNQQLVLALLRPSRMFMVGVIARHL